jgi:hypothetical protein
MMIRMTVANPYAADLGDRNPLEALGNTPERIARLVESWSADRFERSYAPGKWSARKVIVHLAQTELALGTRALCAIAAALHRAGVFAGRLDADR